MLNKYLPLLLLIVHHHYFIIKFAEHDFFLIPKAPRSEREIGITPQMKEQAGSRGKLFLGPGRGEEVRRKEQEE